MVDRWYAVTVRAGAHSLAVLHLKRQFFIAYSPLVKETRLEDRRHLGRTIQIQVERRLQLFPGYVFVFFDSEEDRWGCINGTVGCGRLLGWVGGSGWPKPLPIGFVEELQRLDACGELTAVRAECVVYQFKRGEPAVVRSGPFEGHRGEFVCRRKGSLVLLMTLLGKEFELGFRPHEVAPAPQIAVCEPVR